MKAHAYAAIFLGAILVVPCVADEERNELWLITGEQFVGRISSISEDGSVRLTDGSNVNVRRSIESVQKIVFRPMGDESKGADRINIPSSGWLSGELLAYKNGEIVFSSGVIGKVAVSRALVSTALFSGAMISSSPKDPSRDNIVIGAETIVCDIEEIDKLRVKAKIGEKVEEYPREKVLAIYFAGPPKKTATRGWFAKVHLTNKDIVTGKLIALADGRIKLLSNALGMLTIDSSSVAHITFSESHAPRNGMLMVACNDGKIREFDDTGKEISSTNVSSGTIYASRTPTGNLLVCGNDNGRNKVYEMQNGKIVWEYPHVSYPMFAERMDNGNTLIADYSSRNVIEVSAEGKVVWQQRVPFNVTTATRLPNGNTFLCGYGILQEINAAGEIQWKYQRSGELYPWRAYPLENGNILVVSQPTGSVAEVTKEKEPKIVWRADGLQQPYDASRLDDGATAIVEQGRGRIVVIDRSGKTIREMTNLSSPMGLSQN